MHNVRALAVWRLGMDLAELVYDISAQFPRDERFGMIQQVRRAVLSVPANIAEGSGRRSDREFRRFLLIALGSLEEVETYMEFGRRRAWVPDESVAEVRELADKLRAMLLSFIKRIDADLRTAN